MGVLFITELNADTLKDFLKINHPNVYKNWVAKHGVAIKKKVGSKLSLKKQRNFRKT